MTNSDGSPGQSSGGDSTPRTRQFKGALNGGSRFVHLTLIVLVVVPAVLWLVGRDGDDEAASRVTDVAGELAPDFTVDLFDGSTFTLSEHLSGDGRPVVLNLWASWCIPCREEMPAFDAVARQRDDVLFLGVAVQDTESEARAFAGEVGVGYPLGHDTDGTILEAYPILGLPATRFITSEGMIAEEWFGQLDETTLVALIDRNNSP